MGEENENLKDIESEDTELIKDYLLENKNVLLDVAMQCNGWDGRYDWCSVWDLDDLAHSGIDPFDLARAIVYGNVQNIEDFVRFNGYGNLESVTEDELEDEAVNEIDDIIDNIYKLYPRNNISIWDDGLKELLNLD